MAREKQQVCWNGVIATEIAPGLWTFEVQGTTWEWDGRKLGRLVRVDMSCSMPHGFFKTVSAAVIYATGYENGYADGQLAVIKKG
jgi:hypothetical protein